MHDVIEIECKQVHEKPKAPHALIVLALLFVAVGCALGGGFGIFSGAAVMTGLIGVGTAFLGIAALAKNGLRVSPAFIVVSLLGFAGILLAVWVNAAIVSMAGIFLSAAAWWLLVRRNLNPWS